LQRSRPFSEEVADDDEGARDERALFHAAVRILGELGLDDVLRWTAEGFCEVSGARRSIVLVLDASSGALRGVAGKGVDKARVRGLRIELEGSAAAGRALATGRPQVIVQGDPLGSALRVRPLVCTPIARSTRMLGLVVAGGAPEPLDPLAEDRLVRLADAAAQAWENALHHRRVEAFGAFAFAGRAADQLHDTFAQTLYAIRTLTASVAKTPLPMPTATAVQRIRGLVDHAAEELRATLRVFRLGSSVALGLRQALEEVAAAAREYGSLEVELEVAAELADASDSAAEALLLACREGVAIASRPGRARIRVAHEDGLAVATVEEIDRPSETRSAARLGLAFAQEAIEALGGSLAVSEARSTGPFLIARVPINHSRRRRARGGNQTRA